MKPTLISFDAAGTLINVRWAPGQFAVDCSAEAGLRFDPQVAREKYDRLLHTRWKQYCLINQTRDPKACDDFWAELTRDWVVEMSGGTDGTEEIIQIGRGRLYGTDQVLFSLFADVLPTLDHLERLGTRMVVLSNWDYSLHRILKNLGITKYFEHVFASLEEGPEKPDPKLFKIMAAHMGISAEEVLHVGDNPVDDLEGARGAGMQALLLDRSSERSNPPIVSTLADVLTVLE